MSCGQFIEEGTVVDHFYEKADTTFVLETVDIGGIDIYQLEEKIDDEDWYLMISKTKKGKHGLYLRKIKVSQHEYNIYQLGDYFKRKRK